DPNLPDEENDEINLRAVEAIQRDGRVFISGTRWNGRAGIRAAFVNWSTTPDDVRILQDTLRDVARSHLRPPGATRSARPGPACRGRVLSVCGAPAASPSPA